MPRLRLSLGGRTLGSFLERARRLGRLGLRLGRRGGCSDRSRLRCLQLSYPECLSRPALRHRLRVRLRACELRRPRHLRHARRHLRLGSPALLLGPLRLLAEPATSQRLLLLLPLAPLPFARLLLGLGLEGAGRQSVVIRAHQGSSGLIRAHQAHLCLRLQRLGHRRRHRDGRTARCRARLFHHRRRLRRRRPDHLRRLRRSLMVEAISGP